MQRILSLTRIDFRKPRLRFWSVLFLVGVRLYWFRCEHFTPYADKAGGVLRYISLSTAWEPRDLWVGLYWDKPQFCNWYFYLCLIPCLPLRLHVKKDFGAGGIS